MNENEKVLLIVAQNNFVSELKKQGRASATILAYGKDVEQLNKFLAAKEIDKVDQVTAATIEEFKKDLTQKKYIAKSISRKLNSIKTFFRFLTQQGVIRENPTQTVAYPRYESKAPRVLSKMEYRALRDAARGDVRIAAVIEILLQTGLRISELARLELADVQENRLRVRPFEGHQERLVPLNDSVKKALEKYLNHRSMAKCQSIFVTKTGKQLLVRNIRAAIDRYFRIAEVKNATVNDLRHTFIAHQLAAGAPVVTLQQLVGHKRLSTTEKYLKLVENKVKENVKLEEL
ncbi:MAG: tyrosine-type recombinase/integrase [Candidatus Shapirobacteria bacterium]